VFEFLLNLCHAYPLEEKVGAMAKIIELPDSPEGPHGLTSRQLKILGAIKDAVENNGYPPTMREIGVVAGLTSPASVKYQLEALEKKGFIRRDPTRGRALEVLMPDEKTAENSIDAFLATAIMVFFPVKLKLPTPRSSLPTAPENLSTGL
jgi:repressor LexA